MHNFLLAPHIVCVQYLVNLGLQGCIGGLNGRPERLEVFDGEANVGAVRGNGTCGGDYSCFAIAVVQCLPVDGGRAGHRSDRSVPKEPRHLEVLDGRQGGLC